MTSKDEERLAREIPRLVEEIRLRHGRRMRRASRGRLWMKGRSAKLRPGGSPSSSRGRLAARYGRGSFCSWTPWSVARAGGLFLLLAHEFVKLGRNARVFLFVDPPPTRRRPSSAGSAPLARPVPCDPPGLC